MNSCRNISLVLFIALLVIISHSHAGEIPQLINYSGTLYSHTGDPVPDGGYSIAFHIYHVNYHEETLSQYSS